jgi:vancomycin resistance protein YoaR
MTTAIDRVGGGEPRWKRPTRLSGAVFSAKVSLFRVRRAAVDVVAGPRRLSQAGRDDLVEIAGENRTPLMSDHTAAEHVLQLGKIENLRVACRALDGLIIPTGAVFSFWRQVGPPVARRGFVPGRMLKEGCMVAAVGGGLCQLSNALYDAALQADCGIIERYPHSQIVPGSAAANGRDATVAWNYVDLRFASRFDLRLEARVEEVDLLVRLVGAAGAAARRLAPLDQSPVYEMGRASPRSCASCEEVDCHLHKLEAGSSASRAKR